MDMHKQCIPGHSLGGGGSLSLFCLFLHPVMVNVHQTFTYITSQITSKMLEG